MSSKLNIVSLDSQALIFIKLNFEQLMSYVKSDPTIQLKGKLWEKVLNLADVPINERKLKFMTHYNLYVEHLMNHQPVPTIELVVDKSWYLSIVIKVSVKNNFITTEVDCWPKNLTTEVCENFMLAVRNKTERIIECDWGNSISTKNGMIMFNYGDEHRTIGNVIQVPFEDCENIFESIMKEVIEDDRK